MPGKESPMQPLQKSRTLQQSVPISKTHVANTTNKTSTRYNPTKNPTNPTGTQYKNNETRPTVTTP